MPVSGKTGTTSSNVDIWFSGYTPYYTASIWAGYDSNKPLTNTSFHLTIWRSIMERIHESLPVREFALPDSVEKASVCSITGLRATSSCPTTSELFAKAILPDDYCSGHVVETPDDDDDDKENDNDSDSISGTTQPESPTEPETPTTPETPTEPTPPPTQPETPTDPNTQNPPAQ